jgi:Rod binding domain-containing protein
VIELQSRNAVGSGTTSIAQSTRLQKAAQEFEALLIEGLLEMAKEENASQEPGMEGYGDMSTEGMAIAMSKNGGLGIGKLLIKKLNISVRE